MLPAGTRERPGRLAPVPFGAEPRSALAHERRIAAAWCRSPVPSGRRACAPASTGAPASCVDTARAAALAAVHTGQVAEPDESSSRYEVAVRTRPLNPLPVPPRGAPGWSFVERPHETTTSNDHPLTEHRNPVIPLRAPSRASLGTRQPRSRPPRRHQNRHRKRRLGAPQPQPTTTPSTTGPPAAPLRAERQKRRRQQPELNRLRHNHPGPAEEPKGLGKRKNSSPPTYADFKARSLHAARKSSRKLLPIEMTFVTASAAPFSEPRSAKRAPIPQTGRTVLPSPQAHSPRLQ